MQVTVTSYPLFVLGSVAMELSDANLQTLTEYLKKTLDPDPTIRRPGKENKYYLVLDIQYRWGKPLCGLPVCKFKKKERFTLGISDIVYFSFCNHKVCG